MLALLMLLLLITPIAELMLLIQIGGEIGWPQTILIIVITATVGAWLARREGLRTLTQLQKKLGQSQLPGDELIDGGLIIFAAALLLTPGFLTDIFGLSLLFPPTRGLFRLGLKRYFKNRVTMVSNLEMSGMEEAFKRAGDDVTEDGEGFRDAEFNEVEERKPIEDRGET